MSSTHDRALSSFGRGYRLALTLADDELVYLHVPASDEAAFAQGVRRGLARREKMGVGKIASVLAHHLLSEEKITLRTAVL